MNVWIQSTGHAFKLCRTLRTLLKSDQVRVHVFITACGDEGVDRMLVNACQTFGVDYILSEWKPIMGSVMAIAEQNLAPFILCHDDVMFPKDVDRYLMEIMAPLLCEGKIMMVGGKIWDAVYKADNAYSQGAKFPGKEPFPSAPSVMSCVHSACFAIRPSAFNKINPKADFDFERVIAMSIYAGGGGVIYRPTTDVLWHEKAGTVDHYHELPAVRQYVINITRQTPDGTGFDTLWQEAYGQTPKESLDWLGQQAEELSKRLQLVSRC